MGGEGIGSRRDRGLWGAIFAFGIYACVLSLWLLLNCTFMVFALFHIYAIFHSKKEKKCFLNIFSAGRPWRISCQVRKSACDTRQGPGLGESLNGHSTCPPLLPPTGTHRVVSWLMLVKEELLKELILLLLRSLKKTKSPNRRFHSKKRPGI